MENKVISFPKEKAKKVTALKRLEGQRLFLTMSLFSLVLVAVFTNEKMMQAERPVYVVTNFQGPNRLDELNRAIASAQPVNVFRDVEWEHRLAERLGQSEVDRQPASVSEKITLLDEMRYGPLAGKYRIRSVASTGDSNVAEIEYIDSNEITDKPIQIKDAKAFLLKYRSLMKVKFEKVELAKKADGQEEWRLFQDQKPVGQARFKLDGKGQLLGLFIESNEVTQK